ncbi:putative rapid ALkalinization Factor [Lupinus albus]|uniref:Putative rapid ALkalinization Factor n=1 Tax=Lupinus albus TaxID=3870 RepID=A0A6A4N8A9_LUPAL|nr:putative rapid ALkalinization Factor [Lupinus albus]
MKLVLFICTLLLSMAILNLCVMGNLNAKEDLCKKFPNLASCKKNQPSVRKSDYTRGCSPITRCRRDP